jgi:uncharacterized iron-regulated membrane protein
VLRKIIFWCHLTAGVIAGAVIFILAATGTIMSSQGWILTFAERAKRDLPAVAPGARRLSLDMLVSTAHSAYPEARPTGVTLRADPTATVLVNFGRDGAVYVHPYNGEVLGRGSGLRDFFNAVEDWHRWLGREGETARPPARSPAPATSPFSGSPYPASISGGRSPDRARRCA